MNDTSMSKRIGLTLADAIHDKLERWAKSEGRPIANLCNFLIEKAVEDAEDKGRIPIVQSEQHKAKSP
jgi:predicted DNA-binding protein